MAIALAAVTMGTLAAFASCGSDKTTVTLSGSTSVQPLMEKLGAVSYTHLTLPTSERV